ncbi:glutamate--tRNA ligase family protein [Paenibacillus sp. OAS669]|uniref:glutamate--tRNA ligase family protein n=1 Tax=Paenibacillus sp. OAS669 TaxID=2663821 RepID=UPI0017894BF3|nr:glutamate--tRNA ligase family protein [Paenibacillus sp. OAS669]MBE1444954.1 glutamyl/glutaminyl-tRNA synthetase [Paenibacillus sp. OAS669]
MQQSQLSALLFPHVHLKPQDIIDRYDRRKLQPEAMVTRFAPSPTGFLTIGGLYATFISERLAHQSGGVFYLRIEDTDKKREVEGSLERIMEALDYFGIRYDEGVTASGEEMGEYGPYRQSARAELYQVFIKDLVERDLAYPCFCDEDVLQDIRSTQQSRNEMTGYYGKWAVHRSFTPEQVKEELAKGRPFVIRLKSPGAFDRIIRYTDLALYNPGDEREAWFGKMKRVAEQYGFAQDAKTYKKQPECFKGHVGDVAMVLRLAMTHRTQTPDLYDIMQVMGEDRVRRRFRFFANEDGNE